jgi:ATP-binding cassette subfamily F protein 3
VLLDALEDYGGTLIIVSHDRYFVEKLATKIIEIGHGQASVYPGTYAEFLWHKEHPQTPGSGVRAAGDGNAQPKAQGARLKAEAPNATRPSKQQQTRPEGRSPEPEAREARKREEAERRKRQRANESLQKRITDLEARIADRESQIKEMEAAMSTPGFYEDRDASKAAVDRHQALMWEVGDLMAQWEALQEHASES